MNYMLCAAFSNKLQKYDFFSKLPSLFLYYTGGSIAVMLRPRPIDILSKRVRM